MPICDAELIGPGMTLQPEDETALIRRILDGERDLFHDLIRSYERGVYITLLGMLQNPADAEDAAQETMFKAYRSLARFRGDSSFRTWLMTIALNEGRNRLARSARAGEESINAKRENLESDQPPALLTDWRMVPTEALEQRQLAVLIEDAIRSLPAIYRQVFTLRDLQELEVDEVAKLLDISGNVVRVRLHRARMLLQKQLVPVLKEYAAPARGTRFEKRS